MGWIVYTHKKFIYVSRIIKVLRVLLIRARGHVARATERVLRINLFTHMFSCRFCATDFPDEAHRRQGTRWTFLSQVERTLSKSRQTQEVGDRRLRSVDTTVHGFLLILLIFFSFRFFT